MSLERYKTIPNEGEGRFDLARAPARHHPRLLAAEEDRLN